ncbi:hypothetical protein ACF3MZ_14305 [Paenibacillaceae bacterium WGS1546]|uniref:hypothetical protein n=1 Tax=Cohnella sp. WGS1546 TaxID=3366810 RepID=UPI00372D6908
MMLTEKPKLAALYLKGHSSQHEITFLESTAASLGYRVFDIYTDLAWSDSRMFLQLVDDAQRNCFGAVILSDTGLALSGDLEYRLALTFLLKRGVSLYVSGSVLFTGVLGSKGLEWWH